jgi:hypothetical protein
MELNNVIFLDIDGVLATNKQFMLNRKKFQDKHEEAKELNIPYPFDQKCVKIFNEILKETEADIVLTSDWRLFWDLEKLNRIFKFNKIIKSPIAITSKTKAISMSNLELNRTKQIEEFLDNNTVLNYVVVDDLHLDLYLTEKFVKTKDLQGLKESNIKEKIIKELIK